MSNKEFFEEIVGAGSDVSEKFVSQGSIKIQKQQMQISK
jgi:hypothetical protein